jgi:hypothetical protein
VKFDLKPTSLSAATLPFRCRRLCDAYAQKQEAVLDTRAQLRAWYVWRCHIAKQRRLVRQAMQAEQYYVKRWLLGRAWDRCVPVAESKHAV